MRIISGTYKGRVLAVPKNIKARPTTDKAKEGLFNILSNVIDFEETRPLDVFAGTGSITFELASRGCPHVDTVENNRRMASFIKSNIDKLGVADIVKLHYSDAFQYLKKCPYKYDLIFADPPYDMPGIKDLPEIIFDNGLLNEDALFILEHSKEYNFSNHQHFRDFRNYGHVCFTIFKIKF